MYRRWSDTLRLWQWVGWGFRKVKVIADWGATDYLENIPHRMSGCPVYTKYPFLNSKWRHFHFIPGPVTPSLTVEQWKQWYMYTLMRNVDCTLYLALYWSSFHWRKNTKDTCIWVYSWYFYAYYATLYYVFERCWRFPVQMPQLAVLNKGADSMWLDHAQLARLHSLS